MGGLYALDQFLFNDGQWPGFQCTDMFGNMSDMIRCGAATAAEDVEVGRVRRPQGGQQLPEEVRVSLVESLRSVQLIVAQR